MTITLLVQEAQVRLPQLLNQIAAGTLDKAVLEEYQLLDPAEENRVAPRVRQRFREAVAEIVSYPAFLAADPGGATQTSVDTQSDFQESVSVYTADLYKLIKWIHHAENNGLPQIASALMSFPAAGGAAINDGETFTLSNFDSIITETFEYDVGGGGVTPGNLDIVINGTENKSQLLTKTRGRINSMVSTTGITSKKQNSDLLLVQSSPGTSGNVATSETVVDAGFVLTNFEGGTDDGYGILLKRSKNDTLPRAVLLGRKQSRALKM
jgi:hypothetical protein